MRAFNTKMLKPMYTKEHTCHMVIIFKFYSLGLSLDNQQKGEKLIDTKDQIIICRKSNMHLVSVPNLKRNEELPIIKIKKRKTKKDVRLHLRF